MSSSSPNEPRPQGRLKVYLGYAAGVGKTYQMLQEAHALLQAGVDVVVGYYEPHDRPATNALLEGLEAVPCQTIDYRGSTFVEMDTEAVILRHPEIALVDEFPHSNVAEMKREKRWQDVLDLLDAGISVWTTMNVQHLESLNDEVNAIAGVRVRETIPDWIVQQAAEVVMVDLAPRALLNRLNRGVIYGAEKARQARENFFKESTLIGLREFALREAAFEVEARQDGRPARTEKILVLLTAQPKTAGLIRRAKRVADYFKGQCLAVAVCPDGKLERVRPEERKALEKHLQFARNLHVPAQLLEGKDTATALARYAHDYGVTQIYLARPEKQYLPLPLGPSMLRKIVRLASDVEITVVG